MAKGSFDAAAFSEALSRPGIDPRQWVSFGTVMPETDSIKSVVFDDELGPLVGVILQPSGIEVSCRVSGMCAGNNEAEYFPFISGDEVIVVIPEGEERAGCTIVGRLNNASDAWPTSVAGTDATKNTIAFRRMRTPFVLETSAAYLVRSAITGAFFGLTTAGAFTMATGDGSTGGGALFQLGADTIGFRTKEADTLVEIDVKKKSVDAIAGNATRFHLDPSADSYLYAAGSLKFSAFGSNPAYHVTSIESVAVLLSNTIVGIGTALGIPGAALVVPGAAIGIVNVAIAASVAAPVPPLTNLASVFAGAIALALQVPSDITGNAPGVGSAGVLVG